MLIFGEASIISILFSSFQISVNTPITQNGISDIVFPAQVIKKE
jgi:hypothetical protein